MLLEEFHNLGFLNFDIENFLIQNLSKKINGLVIVKSSREVLHKYFLGSLEIIIEVVMMILKSS